MSTVTYGVVAETYSLENQSRNAYGIVAYADANQDETATVVASAHDITDNRCRAEQLAAIPYNEKKLFTFSNVFSYFFAKHSRRKMKCLRTFFAFVRKM